MHVQVPEVIDALAKSADIVLVDLVGTLERQHVAWRTLTESLLRLAAPPPLEKDEARKRMVRGRGARTFQFTTAS